jgi:aminoglycoside phosphotransferase family enzyme
VSASTGDQPELIRHLSDPACYEHAAGPVRLIETHISWVLLTGEYAYKIKKPLNLGFLDFSSLDKRLHACREEVRLNRRLAPAFISMSCPSAAARRRRASTAAARPSNTQ